MPRNSNIKLIRKIISITDVQNSVMLPKLMERWGLISESEVFRQALSQFYRKMEPEYLKPTINQEIKAKGLTEKQKLEQMTDEEYARDVVQGLILTATVGENPGRQYVVINWYGNSIGAVPVEGCKDWFSTKLDFIENHKLVNTTKPIEKRIHEPNSAGLLENKYGIIVGDEINKTAEAV